MSTTDSKARIRAHILGLANAHRRITKKRLLEAFPEEEYQVELALKEFTDKQFIDKQFIEPQGRTTMRHWRLVGLTENDILDGEAQAIGARARATEKPFTPAMTVKLGEPPAARPDQAPESEPEKEPESLPEAVPAGAPAVGRAAVAPPGANGTALDGLRDRYFDVLFDRAFSDDGDADQGVREAYLDRIERLLFGDSLG